MKNINLSQEKVDAIKRKDGDFFSGENLLENYQASRIAVEGVDRKHLYRNLAKIANGQKLNDVFDL